MPLLMFLEELMKAIEKDKLDAEHNLDPSEHLDLLRHPFFQPGGESGIQHGQPSDEIENTSSKEIKVSSNGQHLSCGKVPIVGKDLSHNHQLFRRSISTCCESREHLCADRNIKRLETDTK